MKKNKLWSMPSFLAWVGLVLALFCSIARAEGPQAPDVFVREFSANVLNELKANKKALVADPAKLDALVDREVMPHVDFTKMTRLVVGAPWRSATPAQRDQVVALFRGLLIKTYSGALSQVGSQTLEIDKPKMRPEDTDVIVTSRVIQTNGAPPVDLAYRVEKKDGQWKVYDLSVLGLWLVDSYKAQFKPILSNGGMDALIAGLKAKNGQ